MFTPGEHGCILLYLQVNMDIRHFYHTYSRIMLWRYSNIWAPSAGERSSYENRNTGWESIRYRSFEYVFVYSLFQNIFQDCVQPSGHEMLS